MLNTLTTSSVITLTTLYLQDAAGFSPLAAAAALVPFCLAVIAGSTFAAPALRRWRPPHVVAAGLLIIAVSNLSLGWVAPIHWALSLCLAASGVGLGLSSVASTALGTDVEPGRRGTASGIINTAAQLGTALGISALVLVAVTTTGTPRVGGPVPWIAWAFSAAVALAGAAAFTRWGYSPRAALDRSGQLAAAPLRRQVRLRSMAGRLVRNASKYMPSSNTPRYRDQIRSRRQPRPGSRTRPRCCPGRSGAARE